jgi:hypothetical protein
MKQSHDFDTILDECLERVFSGESVDTCLAAYPDEADELRPLLETVLEARTAADVAPRPEFRQEASRRFQMALRDLPVKRPAGTFSFRHWWVTTLAVLALVVFGGGGTVLAANGAQPDNFLYSVKLTTESVRISLAGGDQAKAELYAEFAGRRVDEILAMADKGNAAAVDKATGHLDRQLVAMAGVVGNEQALTAVTKSDHALSAPLATSTTTATTTAPAATQAPSLAAPSPTAPPPTVTFGQSSGTGLAAGEAAGAGNTPFEQDVSAQAAEAAQRLQDALASAPEAARQGLEHALEVVTNGYGHVLHGLRH